MVIIRDATHIPARRCLIRRPRPSSAFTLVELLVVTGIIAVLISIVLSVSSGIRKQARVVQCCANLRSIGQATLANAAERGGYLPLAGRITVQDTSSVYVLPSALGDDSVRHYSYAKIPSLNILTLVPFIAALAPHLGVADLPRNDWNALDQALNAKDGAWRHFTCPDTNSYDKATVGTAPGDNTVEGQATMMLVATDRQTFIAWATNSDYVINEGVFGHHYNPAFARNRLSGKLARITRPPETVLFTDGVPRTTIADPLMPFGWMTWTPSLNGVGTATLTDALNNTPRASSSENFDLLRHNRRMNVVFADGHVETLQITPESLAHVHLISP
ncbi:prepilin-type N-terminal cleavage/methylation domain-containing protein [Humisphaera borealis]|uniref:Prepilin-type N-terminal cleavage/methylation domain-containing protein n=1 Tax=Humisphaera borealis TaxID=2807512 RepID=A0A7M2WV14_9BACT|nr:prepilin-type N-terminal cleavage/methylation domain-containing protein [Humisphaera borealis]QOV89229.1 prepilin-type N-terminal cleavage/methylation domain-containing protein [Humisphaera borealis]